MPATPDRLTEMLTQLKLTAVRDQLDGLLDEAGRQDLSLRETLVLVCEREIARKDERRIEMTLKLARFPFVRDLSGFDFSAQPSIDPKQMRELAAARWIANGENVLLLGPARCRQDASCSGARARSDPGRAFRAVRGGDHGCCTARQRTWRRPA
jgi:DNA replication protein DnaC